MTILTPKEKAQELVDKFSNVEIYISIEPTDIECQIKDTQCDAAKQCALIAVDEIIDSSPRYPSNVDWDDCGASHNYYYEAQREEALKYWEEVKQEINNL